MVEELRPETSKPGLNPAIDFIYQRLSMSDQRPADRRSVAMLLEGQGDFKSAFFAFAKEMSDTRRRFTLDELHVRDEEAVHQASMLLPADAAQRRAILRREDRGVPCKLELLLILLIADRLEELRAQSEEDGVFGELSVRNSIEAVLADAPRTRKFIEGVKTEVQKFSGAAISVYDIGCGPFPILGLSAALESPGAKVTCIESNPLSAKIAQAVVDAFVERGAIERGQMEIRVGDAMDMPLPPKDSIDLLISETFGAGLLEERGVYMFRYYTQSLNSKHGSTIPYRAKLSAALMPTSQGITHIPNKERVVQFEHFIINANGQEIPVIPEGQWNRIDGGRQMLLSDVPREVQGVIDVPSGLRLRDLENYGVSVCAELIVNRGGKRGVGRKELRRYSSFPTSPILLGVGFIVIPPDDLEKFKGVDSSKLEIQFSFRPGGDSREATVKVVRKKHA